MLTCCTNIHGQEIVHCLRVESFSVEVGKGGSDSLKVLCCFLYGGLLSQDNRAGFDVAINLKMSSKTAECEFDFVLQFRRNGVLTRGAPYLNLGRLQFKVD